MREVTGNLWTYPADVRAITTNGTVKKNGECVMGRGCAAEAKQRYPGIAWTLGQAIKSPCGNQVHILRGADPLSQAVTTARLEWIVSFPVKHEWYQKANMDLIRTSAKQLLNLADIHRWLIIVLPRPGCGNGGLRWEDVRLVIAPILDDRFHVITFA